MLRILLTLLILIIVIVITVQIVLKTTLPKTLVLGKVEQLLGLNVHAKSLQTGWFGHTVLQDVTISLPLADKAFLKVPELRVEHSSLLMIALTRAVKLESIEIDSADLVVRQDESGRWDVQQALELIARTSGAKNTEEKKQPTLPALRLTDGTVHVIDRAGREATIEPVNVRGEPQNSLAWEFSASAGDQLEVQGAVNPGGAWQHTANFSVQKPGDWLKPWVANLPDPIIAKGRWEGRTQDGQVHGQARLENITAGEIHAAGVLNVARNDAGLHLRPDGIVIQSPVKLAPEVRVNSGDITVEADRVVADALLITAAGGDLRVNGNYSWAEVAGEIDAVWEELTLPQGVVHAGSARASLKSPLPNRPEIAASLRTRGESAAGKWKAEIDLAGKGESWKKIDWTLSAPLVDINAFKREFDVRQLTARLVTDNNVLRLIEMNHPGSSILRGTGELNLANLEWVVDVSAEALPLPGETERKVDLALKASGQSVSSLKLKEAHLRQDDLVLEASGFYDASLPKPVNLTIDVSQSPTIAEEETDPLIKGTLRSKATVAGTLAPFDIVVAGDLEARQFALRDNTLGTVKLAFDGTVNGDGAQIQTRELTALGGRWKINGTWAGEGQPVSVRMSVRDLPLAEVVAAAKQEGRAAGTLSGEWELVTSSLRPSRMKVSGKTTIIEPSAGPVKAEKLTATMSVNNGIVRLDSIEAQKERGRLTATASFPLLHPTQWHVEGDLKQWPHPLPRDGSSVRVAGQMKLDADLATRAVTGTLNASSDVVLQDEPVGVAKLSASAQGDVIRFSDITADFFGGSINGSGAIFINEPLQSQAMLRVQNVNAKKLAEVWPQLGDLSGMYNALVVVSPTKDPRALGPLRLALTVHPTDGKFRSVDIGNIDAVAYAARDNGLSRIVIDDSTINIADGQVRIWGRRSEHPGPTTQQAAVASTQIDLNFTQLDLNQITHAAKPDGKPVPGRVAGRFVLAGNLAQRDRLYGSGNVQITQSDLGNSKLFGAIYSFLNLQFGQRAPDGRGSADLRLQGDLLQIDNARYAIGGAEVRMSGTISDLFNTPDSPIAGRAIASVQPFAEWKIPLIKEAGEFFATLQSSTVGAFRIDGTVGDPKVIPAAVDDATSIFRDLLGFPSDQNP